MGIIRGADSRTSKHYAAVVELRETTKYWSTATGIKFRKTSGYGPGDFPRFKLDLNSIKTKEAK
jgi:hypothetical protein